MGKITALMFLIMSFAVINLGNAQTTGQKVIELSMTSCLPKSSIISQGLIAWGKELERRTGGRVKIGQDTWGGALLKTSNTMQGLGQGVVDVAYIFPNYARSLFPVTSAAQPLFLDDGYHAGYVLKEMHDTIPEIREEWRRNNIRPLYFTRGSNGILGTTFKVNKLEDLKAKRLRAVGEAHDLVANLGAIPINISPGDVYVALQKGTVDGFVGLPAYVLHTYKLAEVLKQVTDTGFGCYGLYIGGGMNLQTYNKLPEDVKKIIEEIAPFATEHYAKADDEDGFRGLELARQKGLTLLQLPPDEAERWRKAVNPPSIWERYIKEAEAAGYPARNIMEKALKIWDREKKNHPHNPLFNRFMENK